MSARLTWNPNVDGLDTRWEGGLIRYNSKGRPTFVIERMVQGRRYVISTRAHSVSPALKHLARFEADPVGYSRVAEPDDAVFLSEELQTEFLDWSRNEKKNSPNWVSTQRIYLDAWREQLFGRDLRKLSLRDDVDPALELWGNAKPHRIKVLKALMGWLRKVKRLVKSAEDATIDLPVPQARPEQTRRMKAISQDHFDLALEHLAVASVRDGLLVLGATGCHYSELVRFVREGSIEPVPSGAKDAAGVLVFQHKSGVPHRVRVLKQALAAARRLRDRAVAWDHHTFNDAIASACRAASIPVFHSGQLRHSVATWAINEGAEPAQVASFLGHRSVTTTKRFYATHAAPKRVPTLVR